MTILDTRIEFGQNDIENVLARMSDAQIDKLPFGAIELDADGVVLRYNATESGITGRSKETVLGRNFFREIAPCCNTSIFKGAFDHGVRSGRLDTIFTYTFDYRMKPVRVKIHMRNAMGTKTYWIFVKRL
jgi:photoactive yellow protein